MPATKKCPECRGNETYKEVMNVWGAYSFTTREPCPTCKGKGRIKNVKPSFRAIGG